MPFSILCQKLKDSPVTLRVRSPQVSLTWSSSNAQPGDQVSLTVTVVEPPSQVGILVIGADDGAREVERDLKAEKVF